MDEFILDRVELPNEAATATLTATSGLAILLIVKGVASIEQLDDETDNAVGLRHQLAGGAVHLVCPHTVLRIKAVHGPVLLYRAAAKPLDDDIVDVTTGLTIASAQ